MWSHFTARMNSVILVLVFVFVIPFADVITVEDSSESKISAVYDDVEKAARIINDFHDVFTYATSNFARLMLPVLLKITQEVNISRSCIESGMRFLDDLKQSKSWALKLIDSFGKPLGIFTGKFWYHGNYDQCLKIEVKDNEISKRDKTINSIYGKFCALTVGFNSYKFIDVPEDNKTRKIFTNIGEFVKPHLLNKVLEMADFAEHVYRMDICIPSTCNREDIENILQWAVKDPYRAEVKFCKMKNEKVLFSTTQIVC
ncbi:uncharacterized protein LOC111637154, partial [Centruroides sculpturatus]|uniref:uncharacterized protein LOC111637154 n=1 Tax=Centruroides sculpturatus TaxID=218467 RepID=UPI000C6ED395